MNATAQRWVYEVWNPQRHDWTAVRELASPREMLWGFNYIDFALGDGEIGTRGRLRATVSGEIVEVTEYVRQRDATAQRLRQIASDFEYEVISTALRNGTDRYFLIVERRQAHWQAVEHRRNAIPRGYKTLRSALNTLWKHRSAKSGQWPERYALFDLQTGRVIGEYIIEIAEYLGGKRADLRRKASVAMLELAIRDDRAA